MDLCRQSNAGDPGLIPGSGRPLGEGHGNPLQYSCLENSKNRGGMVGYSPWSRREVDTTGRLTHTLHSTRLPQTADIMEALRSRQDLGSLLRGGKNLTRQGKSRTSQGHEGVNSCGIQATVNGNHWIGAEVMMGSYALNLRKGCDKLTARG